MAVEAEGRGGNARLARANERVGVLAVRRDGAHGQPGVEERLQVRPVAAHEPPDHANRPITSAPGSGASTTAPQPMPRLKTRRSSSSSMWPASQSKTGG